MLTYTQGLPSTVRKQRTSLAVRCSAEKKNGFQNGVTAIVAGAVFATNIIATVPAYAEDSASDPMAKLAYKNNKQYPGITNGWPNLDTATPSYLKSDGQLEKVKAAYERDQQRIAQTYGAINKDSKVYKDMVAYNNANQKLFDDIREAKKQRAYATAHAYTAANKFCNFPNNFLGCDGKFGRDPAVKKAAETVCAGKSPGDCNDDFALGVLTGNKKF